MNKELFNLLADYFNNSNSAYMAGIACAIQAIGDENTNKVFKAIKEYRNEKHLEYLRAGQQPLEYLRQDQLQKIINELKLD